jgi:hypothetical protein
MKGKAWCGGHLSYQSPEAEAGECWVGGKPGLHSESLAQRKNCMCWFFLIVKGEQWWCHQHACKEKSIRARILVQTAEALCAVPRAGYGLLPGAGHFNCVHRNGFFDNSVVTRDLFWICPKMEHQMWPYKPPADTDGPARQMLLEQSDVTWRTQVTKWVQRQAEEPQARSKPGPGQKKSEWCAVQIYSDLVWLLLAIKNVSKRFFLKKAKQTNKKRKQNSNI